LTVGDDGDGPPDSAAHTGFGLRGLQERAERLGGAMWFEARPGGGAQLRFWAPNAEAEQSPGGIRAAQDTDKVEV
jgi:signal transduction histidine kinase